MQCMRIPPTHCRVPSQSLLVHSSIAMGAVKKLKTLAFQRRSTRCHSSQISDGSVPFGIAYASTLIGSRRCAGRVLFCTSSCFRSCSAGGLGGSSSLMIQSQRVPTHVHVHTCTLEKTDTWLSPSTRPDSSDRTLASQAHQCGKVGLAQTRG